MQLDPAYWLGQREHSDVFADTCVQTLLSDGSYEKAHDVLGQFMGNNDAIPADAPQALVDYMHQAYQLPDWYDEQRVLRAQRLSHEYGLESAVILLCKSLPQCYALAKGARVLAATGRLMNHQNSVREPFVYRIMETLQFVANVSTEGSFQTNGDGISTVRRIRLIHAAIRTFLMNSHQWDAATLGAPINQEDLVLTLTTFSVSILQGWKQLGIVISDEQQGDILHLWAVVGYMLGIHPDNIPRTYEENVRVQELILRQQVQYSQDGVELTDSVKKFVVFISGGWIGTTVTNELMHLFLSDNVANAVGVPHEHPRFIARCVRLILVTVVSLQQRWEWFSRWVRLITGRIVMFIIHKYAGPQQIRFPLPQGLRQ